MNLFGKDKHSDSFGLESPKYDLNNLKESGANDKADTDKTMVGYQQRKPKPKGEYGIQDAIELMRQLPNVNTDIVITVVIKTLESANIQVDEIIADAQDRETRIENRSVELITKIDELESQIAELNEEITQLNSDLEETTKVKTLLLGSLERDKPKPNVKPAIVEKTNKDAPKDAEGKENEGLRLAEKA